MSKINNMINIHAWAARKLSWAAGAALVFALVPSLAAAPTSPFTSSLDASDVVWDSPSDDSRGSMPLGNGDIGLNAWVEKGGDLLFYISKTDAWGDDLKGSYGQPKVGRVRVRLAPNPFRAGTPFRQTLRLQQGEIQIVAGNGANKVVLSLWVDANNPVIHLDETGAQPERMQVSVDSFRMQAAHGLNADIIFPAQPESVAWCYRNTNRNVPQLTNLTFGALINGLGFRSLADSTLQSVTPRKQSHVSIYPLTAQTDTPEAWRALVTERAASFGRADLAGAHRRHLRWWQDFWNRSWVVASGNADAQKVTQEYARQRFVTACAGRGVFPIKFNGSLFTTDYTKKTRDDRTKMETSEDLDADYRDWGGQYWFQNTRAMYWPMLQSGDFEMMQPLFRMYRDKLPASEKMVRAYYGHAGTYFAETSPFYPELPNVTPDATPSWTLEYYTPILELSSMMLDYYAYTGDKAFVQKTLIPVADDGVTFFDQHFRRDAAGKLNLDPDNAIETYWGVHNPAPDIAGLDYVLRRLLALPADVADQSHKDRWQRILAEVPPLPEGMNNGKEILLPYESARDSGRKNGENPELYAVYPFRLYGLGKPDLGLARDTFAVRQARGTTCWLQDPIHAAYLGDTETARQDVIQNFSNSSKDPQERFPTFWGPFHDYTPDEDNGGNGLNALQLMLLQSEGTKLLLLPAWPLDWDAQFKLHAPLSTTVEGTVHAGHLVSLSVTPRSRRGDVFLVKPDGTLTPF